MSATPVATKQPMRFVTKWKSLIQALGDLLMALGVLAATSIRRNRSPSTWMARWNRQREVRLISCVMDSTHGLPPSVRIGKHSTKFGNFGTSGILGSGLP